MVEKREYYVYALYRLDGRPFYVGKGKGDRWLFHDSDIKTNNRHKLNIIKKIQAQGLEVPKAKLHENLTQEEAFEIEKQLIAGIGRWPNGPLVNQTDGGEGHGGYVMPEEIKKKISKSNLGKKMSPEYVEKMRARVKIQMSDPEVRKASSERIKRLKPHLGHKHTEDARRKMSIARRGKKRGPLSEEHKAKLRCPRSFSEEHFQNVIASNKARAGIKHTEEHKRKIAEAGRGRKHSAETRKKLSAGRRGKKHSEESKRKMSETIRRRRAERMLLKNAA